MINCPRGSFTPISPCIDSVPCKELIDAACVQLNGTLPCVEGENPRLDTILAALCAQSYPCPDYTSLPGLADFALPGLVAPQYSIDSCGMVSMRGEVVEDIQLDAATDNFLTDSSDVSINPGPFATLPVGLRPTVSVVQFPCAISLVSNTNLQRVISGILIITSNGQMSLRLSGPSANYFPADVDITIIVSLDPVRYKAA